METTLTETLQHECRIYADTSKPFLVADGRYLQWTSGRGWEASDSGGHAPPRKSRMWWPNRIQR